MKIYTSILLLLVVMLIEFANAQTVIEPTLIWDPFGNVDYSRMRVKGGGDLNGDGFNDIVLIYPGFENDSTGVSEPREVRIYFGGTSFDTIPDVILPTFSDEKAFVFGNASYNGDLNNDGYDDLVIGCSYYYSGSSYVNEGAILIYLGRAKLKTEPDFILKGRDYATDTYGLAFGAYVDLSGDFNGDGYDDLVASTRGPSYYWNGQVDIFYGGKEFDTVVDWHKKGEYEQKLGGDGFSIGDINGDGFDDLVIPRQNENDPDGDDILEIYAGGTQMDTLPDYTCFIDSYHPQYADCGDFNGDGCADYVYRGGILKGASSFHLEYKDFELDNDITNLLITDIDNDEFDDLAWASVRDYSIDFYKGNPDFIFNSNYQFLTPDIYGFGTIFIDLGNIDEDPKREFLVSNIIDDDWRLELYSFDSISSKITEFKKSKELQLLSYPNPFNSSTIISFNLQENIQNGELAVYNPSGQLVSTLYTGNLSKGNHSFTWQANNQAAGVYLVKLKSENKVTTKKLLYVK